MCVPSGALRELSHDHDLENDFESGPRLRTARMRSSRDTDSERDHRRSGDLRELRPATQRVLGLPLQAANPCVIY